MANVTAIGSARAVTARAAAPAKVYVAEAGTGSGITAAVLRSM